jgi:hypothetical protein
MGTSWQTLSEKRARDTVAREIENDGEGKLELFPLPPI